MTRPVYIGHRSIDMIETLVLILLSLIGGNGDISEAQLYEVGAVQVDSPYYGQNWQFEDGSYTEVIGSITYSECVPFSLCSEINLDTDWEDILHVGGAQYMDKIVRLYQDSPRKFKDLIANEYH
jgi:hypothetical protein